MYITYFYSLSKFFCFFPYPADTQHRLPAAWRHGHVRALPQDPDDAEKVIALARLL